MAHKESALLRAFQFRRTSTAISWYSHQRRGHGAGESNYVQKQMGHKSIQITIDVYGHLIPGENVAWIDTLDKTPQKVTATYAHQPHTQSRESEEEILKAGQNIEAEEVIWLPPRDSNPDMLIQSQLSCR